MIFRRKKRVLFWTNPVHLINKIYKDVAGLSEPEIVWTRSPAHSLCCAIKDPQNDHSFFAKLLEMALCLGVKPVERNEFKSWFKDFRKTRPLCPDRKDNMLAEALGFLKDKYGIYLNKQMTDKIVSTARCFWPGDFDLTFLKYRIRNTFFTRIHRIPDMKPFVELAGRFGFVLFFPDKCFLNKPAIKIYDNSGPVDRIKGPAVEYSDGFELYVMNNRVVSRRAAKKREAEMYYQF